MSCIHNQLKKFIPNLKFGKNDITNNDKLTVIKRIVDITNNRAKGEGFTFNNSSDVVSYSVSKFGGVELTLNKDVYEAYTKFQEFYNSSENAINRLSRERDLELGQSLEAMEIPAEEPFNPELGPIKDSLPNNTFQDYDLDGSDNSSEVFKFLDEDFTGWINKRRDHLAKLKEIRYELNKKGATLKEKQELSKTIKALEKELNASKTGDISSIINFVGVEINMLKRVFPSKDTSFDSSEIPEKAKLLETLNVDERLSFLFDVFLSDSEEHRVTRESFASALNNLGSDTPIGLSYTDIVNRLNQLKNLRKSAMDKIIYGLLTSNDLVREQKIQLSEAGKLEEYEALLEKLKNIVEAEPGTKEHRLEGDAYFGALTLGANSYDSVLPELTIIARDINANKEAGTVLSAKTKVTNSYALLNGVKVGDEYVTDIIMERGMFGERTNKLISHTNYSEYYPTVRRILESKMTFENSTNPKSKANHHKSYMNRLRSTSDFIHFTKTPEFYEMYKDHPKAKDYFKYSENERKAYKRDVVDKIGEIAYEIEYNRQLKYIQTYLNDDSLDAEQDAELNPFEFLERFYDRKSDFINEGKFMKPDFLYPMPKLTAESNWNPRLKELEGMNIPGLKGFLTGANELLDYSRKTVGSEGIHMDYNYIPGIKDELNREVMSELSFFGSITKTLKQLLKNVFANYYTGASLENPENDKNFVTGKTFNPKYSDYGAISSRDSAALMRNWSLDKLVNKAKELGLNPRLDLLEEEENNPLNEADRKVLEESHKLQLAKAIAAQELSKSMSLDLQHRVLATTEIAESINTRRNTQALISLLKEYAAQKGAKNTEAYLKTWEINNILQPGYQHLGKLATLERKKLISRKSLRHYTEAEKSLKKLLEDELKNLKGDLPVDFIFEDINYKYDPSTKKIVKIGLTSDIISEPIYAEDGSHKLDAKGSKLFTHKRVESLEEIEVENPEELIDAYEKYLQDKLDNLGLSATVGSIMAGVATNMFYHFLGVSGFSGLKNRIAGRIQNNQAAASGIHGFTQGDLDEARSVLSMHNTKRYINNIPGMQAVGLQNTKDSQNIEILHNLAKNLKLLESVAKDISAPDYSGGVGSKAKNLANNISEFVVDFSMNNPEFHNQMELFLAMLMNVKVPTNVVDSNGNTIYEPIYNPKTKEFIFNSDMSLKSRFNTPDNQDNWVHFKSNSKGSSPQNLVIAKYKTIRDKLHGNYRTDDKIAIQSTITGRVSISMMKWFFENLDNQYGEKQVSLTHARVDIQGRKIVLAKDLPTLGTYLALKNVMTAGKWVGLTGLVAGGSIASPVILIGGLVVTAGTLAYTIKKAKKNQESAKLEFKNALSFAKEVGLRSLRTTVVTNIPYTKSVGKKFDDWMEVDPKIIENNPGLTPLHRKIMSESAQEIADKFNIVVQFGLAHLALQALSILLKSDDDEDDKTWKWYSLLNIEKHMNLLINTRNSMFSDIDKFSSPSALVETGSQFVFLSFLERNGNNAFKAMENYSDGKISFSEMVLKLGITGASVGLGIPNKLLKMIDPDKTIFGDDRVYDNIKVPFLDNSVKTLGLDNEQVAKKKVNEMNKNFRSRAAKFYTKALREEYEKQNIYVDSETLKERVSAHIARDLRDAGMYKNNDSDYSYIEAYKNFDLEKELDALESKPLLLEKSSSGAKKSGKKRKW